MTNVGHSTEGFTTLEIIFSEVMTKKRWNPHFWYVDGTFQANNITKNKMAQNNFLRKSTKKTKY